MEVGAIVSSCAAAEPPAARDARKDTGGIAAANAALVRNAMPKILENMADKTWDVYVYVYVYFCTEGSCEVKIEFY